LLLRVVRLDGGPLGCRLLRVAGIRENVAVVHLANVAHALPVIVLRLERGNVGKKGDDHDGGEQGDEVANEHGVVGARRVHRELARDDLGAHQPGGDSADEADDRCEGGGGPRLAGPEEGQGGRQHGRRDDDTHHHVQVAHGNADVVEARGECGHEEGEADHADVVDAHELRACGVGVDVRLVNVVGDNRRNSNQLRGVG